MNNSIKSLNQALAYQLESVYDIIKQLQDDITPVSKHVADQELRLAFSSYSKNLADNRLKLKRVFSYLLTGPYKRKSFAAKTSVANWSDAVEREMSPQLKDIVLASTLQSVIRYCTTSYTEARYIAMRLELDVVVQLLDEILEEEEAFSLTVKRLSADQVNQVCAMAPTVM